MYATSETPKPKPPGHGQQCNVRAFRHLETGQFYAMSKEDRIAFDKHCLGITSDFNPQSNRERWLATSIAEDQWRLNRARAIESNIFAIGMSGPIADATFGDNAEVTAAVCHARVWLQDARAIQQLALFEQRIRRSIEKNEKQLKELQTERQTAYNKALEEEKLLAWFAETEGETYAAPAMGDDPQYHSVNGFGFSTDEILRLVRREMRLANASQAKTQSRKPIPFPRAA